MTPPVPRPGMGDHSAGLAVAGGIAAAPFERERTGMGQLVTGSLLRSGAYFIASDLMVAINGSEPRVSSSGDVQPASCLLSGRGREVVLAPRRPS
jgi:crotonobetainyl-CoA:carnitine CoA-transferase CaiB-like acyl-CoA transferase